MDPARPDGHAGRDLRALRARTGALRLRAVRRAVLLATALLGALAPSAAAGQPTRRPVPQPPVPPKVPVDTGRKTPARPAQADSAPAQPPGRPAADSGRAAVLDSAARADAQRRLRDSLLAVLRADTLRPPFTRAEVPRSLEAIERWRWTREEAAQTGAVTLADLLDHVPGVTSYRGGWTAGLSAAAYLGDVTRIRVFLDGVALDATDARAGGVLDLTDIQLWLLEDITIERGAGELRVWLRSWSHRLADPYTRVEIHSGDLQTNSFRGVFGKRFRRGAGFEVGGQQMTSVGGRSLIGTGRGAGDGSQQGLFARVGWANRDFSVDGMLLGSLRTRDSLVRTGQQPALARYVGQRRDGYLRLGYRSPERDGPWAQLIGGTLRTSFEQGPPPEPSGEGADTLPIPAADSSRWSTQLVASAGWTAGALRLSAVNRMRTAAGIRTQSPALRANWTGGRVAAGAYVERSAIDSTTRTELSARYQPWGWLAVAGTVGSLAGRVDSLDFSTRPPGEETPRPLLPSVVVNGRVARGELVLRRRSAWLSGGVLRQDSLFTRAPRLLGDTTLRLRTAPATAFLVQGDAPLWKAIRVGLQATRWSNAQLYRPQTQLRTELRIVSEWRSRFPAGDFGFNTRLVHEYRSAVRFIGDLTTGDVRTAEPSQVLGFLLELRLKSAWIGWSYRYLGSAQFQQIPGVPMPRPLQYYGARWEFRN